MSIFDDVPRRPDLDPPMHGEPAFDYLNRSGRLEAQRVRQLVDEWLARYPSSSRDNLVRRLRSPDDDAHHSAFFELFIHELVIARGHNVVAVEPTLSHTDKRPDFLIETVEGHRLYLECALESGRSAAEVALQARLNRALKAIERAQSPAHYLSVSPSGDPTGEVSMKRLTGSLNKWLADLPGDDAATDADRFVYEENGLTLVVRAFPLRSRDHVGRTIGIRHFPAQTVKGADDLRSTFKSKASRYGALDHTYVVAVNALGMFAFPDHAIDALFGSARTAVIVHPDGRVERREERTNDGVWRGPKGVQNTRLSAVLSMEGIDPWGFASRRARLIRNPWAAKPLPPFYLGIGECVQNGTSFRIDEGERIHALLGLPEGWPAIGVNR